MNFLISEKELHKLSELIEKLDGDTQKKFNRIMNHLPPALSLVTEGIFCPPDKIMVDRNQWESILQDLNKQEQE